MIKVKNIYFNLIFFIFIGVISIFIFYTKDTRILQDIWNIAILKPYFADIRTITGYNETLLLGGDLFSNNIGDPWNRPMNYPPIWIFFASFFNLSHNIAYIFGFFNIFLYILSFLLFVNKINKDIFLSILLLLIFFSPASIMLMERGNIDMIIFFLLSLSLFAIESNLIFSTIILFASLLKIYPISTIVILFFNKNKNSNILYIGMTIGVFMIYILYNYEYILLIKQNTPQPTGFAYGLNVFWMGVQNNLGQYYGQIVKYISYIVVFLYAIFLLKFYKNLKTKEKLINNDFFYYSFLIGGIIYMFTFLLNNNFDYRLVFLIFCLPQLYSMATSSLNKLMKALSILSIICIIQTVWFLEIYRFIGTIATILDEFSNWVLFMSIGVILIRLYKERKLNNEYSSF